MRSADDDLKFSGFTIGTRAMQMDVRYYGYPLRMDVVREHLHGDGCFMSGCAQQDMKIY
jgi:hypothetical protein